MQLAIDVTLDDFAAFAQYYYKNTAEGKRGMRRMYFLGLLLYFLFLYSEAQNPEHGLTNLPQFALYAVMAALVLGGLYAAYLWILRPTLIRMMCRSSAFQEMIGPTTISFDAEKLTVENQHGHGRMQWDGVLDFVDTPDHFFLVTGMLRAFIIPKRCFQNAAEADKCGQLLRAYWGNAGGGE